MFSMLPFYKRVGMQIYLLILLKRNNGRINQKIIKWIDNYGREKRLERIQVDSKILQNASQIIILTLEQCKYFM